MREYGKVHTSFWTSNDIQELSEDGKLLALYLLTSPHTTIVGAFRLPDGYISEDLKWTQGRVAKGFAELFAKGFANRCETTKWVWICKFLRWNAPENPNQWKAASKVASTIPPQCTWKADFSRVFEQLKNGEEPEIQNPSERVTQPFRNQEQEQEKEQKPDMSATPTREVFDHWKTIHSHPHAKLDSKREKLIREALKVYSVDDLKTAISGYKHSPHHMGQNERKTVYDDIELFLRDAKHIDAGIKLAANGGIQWQ